LGFLLLFLGKSRRNPGSDAVNFRGSCEGAGGLGVSDNDAKCAIIDYTNVITLDSLKAILARLWKSQKESLVSEDVMVG